MTIQHSPRRLAIVTGASRRQGIGAAVCLALAQAGIITFLASEDAEWVTGQIIRSTGGF